MDIDETNTHADPWLGSRWAQKWVHMQAQVLVIFLVYVTKGNIYSIPSSRLLDPCQFTSSVGHPWIHWYPNNTDNCLLNWNRWCFKLATCTCMHVSLST